MLSMCTSVTTCTCFFMLFHAVSFQTCQRCIKSGFSSYPMVCRERKMALRDLVPYSASWIPWHAHACPMKRSRTEKSRDFIIPSDTFWHLRQANIAQWPLVEVPSWQRLAVGQGWVWRNNKQHTFCDRSFKCHHIIYDFKDCDSEKTASLYQYHSNWWTRWFNSTHLWQSIVVVKLNQEWQHLIRTYHHNRCMIAFTQLMGNSLGCCIQYSHAN